MCRVKNTLRLYYTSRCSRLTFATRCLAFHVNAICTLRTYISASRGGRGCTPCTCVSACRAGRGYTPSSSFSAGCAGIRRAQRGRFSACREGSPCTSNSSFSACHADTGCTPRNGVSASRGSINSEPSPTPAHLVPHPPKGHVHRHLYLYELVRTTI